MRHRTDGKFGHEWLVSDISLMRCLISLAHPWSIQLLYSFTRFIYVYVSMYNLQAIIMTLSNSFWKKIPRIILEEYFRLIGWWRANPFAWFPDGGVGWSGVQRWAWPALLSWVLYWQKCAAVWLESYNTRPVIQYWSSILLLLFFLFFFTIYYHPDS